LSFNPLSFSKPQVTRDVSPRPHLPKEKEPSHCGDIGWDWFLLHQFGLQTQVLYPFYKLCDNKSDDEKVSRYMNGMRYEIQYEMSMVMIRNVEYSYHISLKAEEKLARKQSQRGSGRSQSIGKEVAQDRA
jgi:hypothetical protein